MADTYTVITYRDRLLKFIDWLPDLKETERYYVCLFARKKYCPEVPYLKTDNSQLARFLSNKERLLEKIEQLECRFGSYKINGHPVPQEALALYITPNPRDLYKAAPKSIIQLARLIENQSTLANPVQEVLSEVHRTCGTKHFVCFDIDTKDPEVITQAINLVDNKCDLLETRGGYHLILRKDNFNFKDKLFYKKLAALADVSGDKNGMIPVPGTYQGGFIPYFL
jgi:hypothetical protein